MADWKAAAGLVAVAAITPGPNNLIVMQAGARAGLRGAAPAIAAVVVGSVALVAVLAVGGDAVFRSVPGARTIAAGAGCLYLAWSGAALALASFRGPGANGDAALPARAAAVFAFQFLNPKAWVMALTATSALDAGCAAGTLARLVPLFVVVPAPCLFVWASFGAVLGRALRRPRVRRWTDRILGALLCASALLLLGEIGGVP